MIHCQRKKCEMCPTAPSSVLKLTGRRFQCKTGSSLSPSHGISDGKTKHGLAESCNETESEIPRRTEITMCSKQIMR